GKFDLRGGEVMAESSPEDDAVVPDEPPPAYDELGDISSPSSSSLSLSQLPQYSCDIVLDAVFRMKMEIEDTVKRAADRHWRSVFVHLCGTALHVYRVKRDWGWGGRDGGNSGGPGVSCDNPPWLRRAALAKTYTLLHADVGIAADYAKYVLIYVRRYVIRVRAETDQFLLSCVELPNFVRWLDALFAAINVAPVIDEREFPEDQSLPRVTRPSDSSRPPRPAPVVHHSAMTPRYPRPSSPTQPVHSHLTPEDAASPSNSPLSLSQIPADQLTVRHRHHQNPPSSPTPFSHPVTGAAGGGNSSSSKWRPRHEWTTTHDMIYAKLCYSLLLFRSPRKSDYVVVQGHKWCVDWTTGRMVRVLPPSYFDDGGEAAGGGGGPPFRVWTAENRRI
ncbi:PH domain-containing protein, partial [Apiospora saccharicola]